MYPCRNVGRKFLLIILTRIFTITVNCNEDNMDGVLTVFFFLLSGVIANYNRQR